MRWYSAWAAGDLDTSKMKWNTPDKEEDDPQRWYCTCGQPDCQTKKTQKSAKKRKTVGKSKSGGAKGVPKEQRAPDGSKSSRVGRIGHWKDPIRSDMAQGRRGVSLGILQRVWESGAE